MKAKQPSSSTSDEHATSNKRISTIQTITASDEHDDDYVWTAQNSKVQSKNDGRVKLDGCCKLYGGLWYNIIDSQTFNYLQS